MTVPRPWKLDPIVQGGVAGSKHLEYKPVEVKGPDGKPNLPKLRLSAYLRLQFPDGGQRLRPKRLPSAVSSAP
jgi:hypothetical protein